MGPHDPKGWPTTRSESRTFRSPSFGRRTCGFRLEESQAAYPDLVASWDIVEVLDGVNAERTVRRGTEGSLRSFASRHVKAPSSASISVPPLFPDPLVLTAEQQQSP